MSLYLGIDVGSVTTKFAVLDAADSLVASLYLATNGNPIGAVQSGLRLIEGRLPAESYIAGVATTGSARFLAGVIVDADLVKNEVTCHATAALHRDPAVQTVIEIGGQDSKIIIIRDGMVTDFGLNTVCAAGTGSFLDHQAQRLHLSLEEFGQLAVRSRKPAAITGRCTVFAESAMINKQQTGYKTEDIVYGLCRALARNFLSDIGSGKDIQAPVFFQGGVAFNPGMVRALREELGAEIIVPPQRELMGAIGAALLVHEEAVESGWVSRFAGFGAGHRDYRTSSFECRKCANQCEVAQLVMDNRAVTRWGGKCDLWERVQE